MRGMDQDLSHDVLPRSLGEQTGCGLMVGALKPPSSSAVARTGYSSPDL